MINKNHQVTNTNHHWQQILIEAVKAPGLISTAYRLFHQYSVGNQLLAMAQCLARGLEPSPINTYQGWVKLGRQVRRGETALELCQPMTIKDQRENVAAAADGEPATLTLFAFKARWFALSQTDGANCSFAGTPRWDKQAALDKLGVIEKPFALLSGNVQGYAMGNTFAVSPVAALPHKTTFHELAHIVLGHTTQTALTDDERTPKNLAEVEAQAVALILCETLELAGADYARGYLQSWLAGGEIPERNAGRILAAADRILKAGEIVRVTHQ